MSSSSSQISHLLRLLLLFLTSVVILSTAAPLPDDTTTHPDHHNLFPRSTPGIYICSTGLWGADPLSPGTCSYFTPPLPGPSPDGMTYGPDLPCAPLPYASSQTISFGPDYGVDCIVFRDEKCTPVRMEEYGWPGDDYMAGPANVDLQTGATDNAFKAYGCRRSE